MSMSMVERHRLIAKYVDIIHRIGETRINDATLREHLITDGVDFWAASSLRESNPWTSPIFRRVDVLRGRALPPTNSLIGIVAPVTRAIGKGRSRARMWGYWWANAVASLRNRPRSVVGDVVFVVFMSESPTSTTDREVVARYFGQLPDHVKSLGLTPVVVFLPTNSRPAAMSAGERRTWRKMQRHTASITVTSCVSLISVWRSWRSWRSLQRRAPSTSELLARLPPDVAAMWPHFSQDYEQSVRGTVSARVALLAYGFRKALSSVREARLVVYPFEGQGWESLLEQACRIASVPSLGYLHTIMKPWDLRAHTALSEAPPQILALHGEHDHSELRRVQGVASQALDASVVSVEALRYAYLAENRTLRRWEVNERQLLVVLGSDCEHSHNQFQMIRAEIRRQEKPWRLVVKSHPQCQIAVAEDDQVGLAVGSLQDSFAVSSAVFLCGTAAPLDSYLYGLPTSAIDDGTGYSMNPLESDDMYFVGQTPEEVVAWLADAMEHQHRVPSAQHYFDLSPGLTKWEAIIQSIATQSRR